jgi:hypothetical protein
MVRVDPAAIDAATVGSRVRRHSTRRGVIVFVVVVVGLFVLATRVVPHPVGPARTYDKYRGKAVTTAEAALSAVQTAHLTGVNVVRGNAFFPYSALLVGDAEESLGGLASTFDSIQPPDARADSLQSELDDLLHAAETHTGTVRVTLRRSENPTAEDLDALAADAKKLHEFAERNS